MENALLFYILINTYQYLHLQDSQRGKAFSFLPMFSGMKGTKKAQKRVSILSLD